MIHVVTFRCPKCLAYTDARSVTTPCVTVCCHWCYSTFKVVYQPAVCLGCNNCDGEKLTPFKYLIEEEL